MLSGIQRGEKKIDMDGVGYKLYCRLWVFLYPLRYYPEVGSHKAEKRNQEDDR